MSLEVGVSRLLPFLVNSLLLTATEDVSSWLSATPAMQTPAANLSPLHGR